MRVEQIMLRGFRNYVETTVHFDREINVITGENAQGKTNLLEAVYLLSCGRSFRTRFDREMIGFDRDSAIISAEVFAEERSQNIEIHLKQGQKKQIWKNGSRKTAGDLSETVNTVLFCPNDLYLIREGASARRRLMDLAICQLRPNYTKLLADYNRAYENKSRILRDYRDNPSMLDTLDEFSDCLARLSAQIIRYRAAFSNRLAAAAAPIHSAFSGENETLSMEYQTVSTVTNPTASEQTIYLEVLNHQKKHREAELASGTCLTGIHKDDLDIRINDKSARAFASQGQTRTAALSIKLAERDIFLAETGEYPILLLDDVLSELDARRQAFVLNRISGGQTLITCCEDEQIADKTGGKVIFVNNGTIQE